MLSVRAASAGTAMKNLNEQRWRLYTPLPKILLLVEHIGALAIIQQHACSHAVKELKDDAKHSRWHARAS